MKKNLILCTAQPDDEYFIWQNHLYIESCIEQGFLQNQIHILIYKYNHKEFNNEWYKLKEFYPDINIFVYSDLGVHQYLNIYIPIIRPHILFQHFNKYPELKTKTIIYTDCDILWTKNLDIKSLLENNDEVCYVSNASSYLNYNYLESKIDNALPEKKEELIKLDYIQELCNLVKVSKDVVKNNNNNTGGVQYILKNVDYIFWKKVERDTLNIRKYLLNLNNVYFESENKGIQSWCSDLWAIQWNLWKENKITKVTNKLNFSWALDVKEKLNFYPILHNAGITNDFMNGIPCFYKGKYHNKKNPFDDQHLNIILNNEESKKYCTWYYTKKLIELKNKYNL